MKGSVITGQRQKASLSANNYFGGKRSEGRAWGGGGVRSRSRHFSPASYVSLITSTSWSCEAGVRLPLAEPRLLSDGDWLGPAGTGSDSAVPTVPPVSVRKENKIGWLAMGRLIFVCVFVCGIGDIHVVLPINNPSIDPFPIPAYS